MKKAFCHCSHCQKKRWGSKTITPETENTVWISFLCSYCLLETAWSDLTNKFKRAVKKKKKAITEMHFPFRFSPN